MTDREGLKRTGLHRPVAIIALVALCSLASATVVYHYGTRRSSTPARPALTQAGEPTPCVSYADAAPLVGKSGCITGRVLKVFTSKSGNTYLDFCEDYRACPFSSVIFSQDRAKFGDLATLQGQVVEISGLVSYYKERPQIIIRTPDQLKLRE